MKLVVYREEIFGLCLAKSQNGEILWHPPLAIILLLIGAIKASAPETNFASFQIPLTKCSAVFSTQHLVLNVMSINKFEVQRRKF